MKIGTTDVLWCGGLWIRWGDDGILLDAGPATARLGPELAALRALVLTSGRMSAVGGLPALLEAIAPWRSAELPIHHVLGEERASLLVEAWQRGWPDRYTVSLDAEPPGARFDVGPFRLTTRRVAAGESTVAVRLTGPTTIVWVPLADLDTPIAGLCRSADLAVIQVQTRSDRRQAPRIRPEDAIAAAEGAALVWLVDEDGALLDPPGT